MPARNQIRSGRPEYLLELRLNGTPYRFGNIPLRIARADGTLTTWQEGLVAVEGLPRSADSAAITIAGGSVHWALLASRGQDLASGRATLYRWWAGQTLEQAEVVLDGAVDGPEWGDFNEPLTFTLQVEPWKDRALLPSSTMRIDESTWPVDTSAVVDEPARGAHAQAGLRRHRQRSAPSGRISQFGHGSPALAPTCDRTIEGILHSQRFAIFPCTTSPGGLVHWR